MSTDSLALLRRHAGDDLADLARDHVQRDLTPDDREALTRAARQFSTHAVVGSVAGVALGTWLFMRTRSARQRWLAALSSGAKSADRPVEVRFAGGRVEPLPDLSEVLQPSPWTDAAAGMLFASGGLFLGGELGMVTGSWSARRTVLGDPERKARVESAFRRYRADVLRREVQRLEEEEKGGKGSGILESAKSVVGWQ